MRSMLLRFLRHYFASFCILCFTVFIISCTPKTNKTLISDDNQKKFNSSDFKLKTISKKQAVINFIDSLTIEEQIGQLFLVCVEGTSVNAQTGKNDVDGENCGTVPAGGYIIFRHNCTDSAAQVISLIGNIRTYYDNQKQIQPYFAIDHEGGPVNRLSYLASPLPSQHSVAKFLNEDLASKMYTYAAMQLHALGFQLNFAPVVEVQREDNEEFLGLRTYGSLANTIKYSKIAINAYNTQKVGCVLKHFPGNTATDPHRGLPVLNATLDELNSIYVEPFRKLVQEESTNSGQNIPTGILMSHAVVSAIDINHPSCLSSKVSTYLRKSTGFAGLIFSDDLLMGALADSGYTPSDAVERSLDAGVQVLMVLQPDYHEFVEEIKQKMDSDSTFEKKIKSALFAIICAKIDMGLFTNTLDDYNNYILNPTSVKQLYNLQKQLTAFNEAKTKGDWLYGEYFGK
ncbi:MAG: hypothetical protein BKP49_04995 [Treponema sp. CETP13]|nr:MAG: hypothetical protein BKP49_04995 [Treponema sp. CETP13]